MASYLAGVADHLSNAVTSPPSKARGKQASPAEPPTAPSDDGRRLEEARLGDGRRNPALSSTRHQALATAMLTVWYPLAPLG